MPATLPPITIARLASFGGAAATAEGALAVHTQRSCTRELLARLATAGCIGARASGPAKYLVWAMLRSGRARCLAPLAKCVWKHLPRRAEVLASSVHDTCIRMYRSRTTNAELQRNKAAGM